MPSRPVHELSVCHALLEQVERIAVREQAERVVEIVLQIGPLSGVEPDLLERAFPIAVAGTVAEEAMLSIEQLPVRVRCDECDQESEVVPNRLLCGHCGSFRTHLVSGDEMLLARLELERADSPLN